MRTIGLIAAREFAATVTTRGFIVGVAIVPALVALSFAGGPRLMNQRGSPVHGQVAVVDPTGSVTTELRTTLDPRAIAARRDEAARRALANAPKAARDLAGGASAASQNVVATALGTVPHLELVERSAGADLQPLKEWLTEPSQERHIALVVIHPDAVS